LFECWKLFIQFRNFGQLDIYAQVEVKRWPVLAIEIKTSYSRIVARILHSNGDKLQTQLSHGHFLLSYTGFILPEPQINEHCFLGVSFLICLVLLNNAAI
jgi:hypothetical protein